MISITRVRHVALAVKDLEETLAFYRDCMGLSVVAEERDEQGRATVTLPVGKSAVVLIETGEDRGIDHLAFDTTDGAMPRDGLALDPEEHLGLSIWLFPPFDTPPPPTGRVECIDHIVISSNDSAACAAHFRDKLGLEIKRTMTRPGTLNHLEFGKLHDVVIEFGGPPEPKPGPLEARAWGLVFTVDNIDLVVAAARDAGYPCTDPRPAVQPGAKIAAVKTGTGGVPFALIQYNAV